MLIRHIWMFTNLNCYSTWSFVHSSVRLVINPIWPGLWKDVKARGGHYGPPRFFSFGATKSPKLNLGTFLALKTTWKAILNIFRSLSLVARGRQISTNSRKKKSKFWVSRVLCTSNKSWEHAQYKLSLKKYGLLVKKNKKFQNIPIFA